MSQQKNLVQKSVDEVAEVIELFYQQKLQKALDKFTSVIGGMMTAIDSLFTYKAENQGFMLDEIKLINILKDATVALENGDLVLLADILQYDYLEYINELLNSME